MKKTAVIIVIFLLLTGLFSGCGQTSGTAETSVTPEAAAQDAPEATTAAEAENAPTSTPVEDSSPAVMDDYLSPVGSQKLDSSSGLSDGTQRERDAYLTDPVPEGKPLPVESGDAVIVNEVGYCTISITCATILVHLDDCDADKLELVPEDGWILRPVTVSFNHGESVFDVLQRVTRDNGIHMEFVFTPLYNSAYIQGIHNLYEFDVGELSGWMYSVNGWFPNYGCSRYVVQDGDTIEWCYTCDLGYDIGGGYVTGE